MSQVRDVINGLDEAVWTISPKNDSLPSLAAFLGNYTERFVAPTGIRHRLDLDPQFPPLPVPSQLRHNLLLAVKEALNNAVRHANPGTVRLKIHARDGWLEVEVADDGRGFDVPKGRAGGHGLANLEERMRMINGRVDIRSQPDKGTTVTFSMPLSG
jgi:signal transduction histidine kinase